MVPHRDARAAQDRDPVQRVEQEREPAEHQQRRRRPASSTQKPTQRSRYAAAADDRQHQPQHAQVRVHLVVGIEAVHPVGVAGAGAVRLADHQRRQQLRVPRAVGQFLPGQPPGAGRAVEQLLRRDPLHGRQRRPQGDQPAGRPDGRSRRAGPRSIATR